MNIELTEEQKIKIPPKIGLSQNPKSLLSEKINPTAGFIFSSFFTPANSFEVWPRLVRAVVS